MNTMLPLAISVINFSVRLQAQFQGIKLYFVIMDISQMSVATVFRSDSAGSQLFFHDRDYVTPISMKFSFLISCKHWPVTEGIVYSNVLKTKVFKSLCGEYQLEAQVTSGAMRESIDLCTKILQCNRQDQLVMTTISVLDIRGNIRFEKPSSVHVCTTGTVITVKYAIPLREVRNLSHEILNSNRLDIVLTLVELGGIARESSQQVMSVSPGSETPSYFQ